jgi:HPt (histidine-containing phosphotransfer) domain-containing protein
MTGTPVLDPAPLARLRRLGGAALAQQMLALFREAAPQRLAAVRAAAAAGDLPALARAAHALVSNAGNVGGTELMECARSLEAAGTEGRAADVPVLVERLDAAFLRLLASLAAAEREVPA